MNEIRKEMTDNGYGNWGERFRYWGFENGSTAIVPFDAASKEGNYDIGKYISFQTKYNLKIE